MITKIFTFPLGTKIIDTTIESNIKTYEINKKITPCPVSISLNGKNSKLLDKYSAIDVTIYNSDNLYPEKSYFITKGAGLMNNEHVLFYNVHIVPQYNPIIKIISIPYEVEITINFIPPSKPLFNKNNEYDMVIISPEEFTIYNQLLIDHKNSVGIQTFLKTTEEIYTKYIGRDNSEKIKYFIKDAIEIHNINYVLLCGEIAHLPIRTTSTSFPGNFDSLKTDLYYADIYDSNINFSSWDSNNNDKFGEFNLNIYVEQNHSNYYVNWSNMIIDFVDIYPDVYIGRIPCKNILKSIEKHI